MDGTPPRLLPMLGGSDTSAGSPASHSSTPHAPNTCSSISSDALDAHATTIAATHTGNAPHESTAASVASDELRTSTASSSTTLRRWRPSGGASWPAGIGSGSLLDGVSSRRTSAGRCGTIAATASSRHRWVSADDGGGGGWSGAMPPSMLKACARCGSSSAMQTSSAGTSTARLGASACSMSAVMHGCAARRDAGGDGCVCATAQRMSAALACTSGSCDEPSRARSRLINGVSASHAVISGSGSIPF
eukprot:351532-Chlamydomonas_euryale.AAC.5